MKHPLLFATLAGSSLLFADVAAAQWLEPQLDSQRWANLRKHQQEQAKKAAEQRKRGRPDDTKPVTLAERQAAWSRNKREYRQRLLRDGQTSADRWLDSIVRANR
ncbi:hypothetical protein [Sphingopyxis sp.]|uniref:hypothetical protein n=1 Tax=Sphingopyxis sp. TaxID=1908224 RepID=UPI002D775095|nr:hypothetical protein [Sphingopyxis sp.]HET6523931.1 hypothetical protein [Sphingopyxis sp.]